MAKRPEYPFVPKSTAYIEPGHFWSIPLSSGGYACGRVVQLWIENGSRQTRMFLAGLMDWAGIDVPTADGLVGCRVIEQGLVHIKTIGENGGKILGFRDLALDGIEPGLFLDASFATCVQYGLERLRPFDRKKDDHLPVLCTWGFGVIKILAEKHFGAQWFNWRNCDPHTTPK
jgi:hypothetical protein